MTDTDFDQWITELQQEGYVTIAAQLRARLRESRDGEPSCPKGAQCVCLAGTRQYWRCITGIVSLKDGR